MVAFIIPGDFQWTGDADFTGNTFDVSSVTSLSIISPTMIIGADGSSVVSVLCSEFNVIATLTGGGIGVVNMGGELAVNVSAPETNVGDDAFVTALTLGQFTSAVTSLRGLIVDVTSAGDVTVLANNTVTINSTVGDVSIQSAGNPVLVLNTVQDFTVTAHSFNIGGTASSFIDAPFVSIGTALTSNEVQIGRTGNTRTRITSTQIELNSDAVLNVISGTTIDIDTITSYVHVAAATDVSILAGTGGGVGDVAIRSQFAAVNIRSATDMTLDSGNLLNIQSDDLMTFTSISSGITMDATTQILIGTGSGTALTLGRAAAHVEIVSNSLSCTSSGVTGSAFRAHIFDQYFIGNDAFMTAITIGANVNPGTSTSILTPLVSMPNIGLDPGGTVPLMYDTATGQIYHA